MSQQPVIVFVCEHGAAKSIIAATFFEQLARDQGIEVRAAARGTNPDSELSQPTVAGLSKDGLVPIEGSPKKLAPTDMQSAQRIVSFCDLPAGSDSTAIVERWDDVPAVSEDYDKARDAIVRHVHDLLSRIRSSL